MTPRSAHIQLPKHNQHAPPWTATQQQTWVLISGMIRIGQGAKGICKRGALGRDVRQDQVRDGAKVAEKEEGTLSKGMRVRQMLRLGSSSCCLG